MDLDGVRTFVIAAGAGQFQAAADELDLTQQAVSRRVATLEKSLGVRLFIRTPSGVELTADGQAFLPHARRLLWSAERARDAVRPGQRPLRVDVVSRRSGTGALLREFHRAHAASPVEVVTLFDAGSAIAAIVSGSIDATFRCVTIPPRPLPDGIRAAPALDEGHILLTGPGHELAAAESVTLAELTAHRIWIPGMTPGTEWTGYYQELAARSGLRIEASSAAFGADPMVDVLATTPELATLLGEGHRLDWPASHDLRRIPIRDPAASYPHSLLWRAGNPHPGLRALRKFLGRRAA
jgi:DNA-binding transcriptional LysR family regulator